MTKATKINGYNCSLNKVNFCLDNGVHLIPLYYHENINELYNLEDDPQEHNLADKLKIEQGEQQLKGKLLEWFIGLRIMPPQVR